MFLEFGVFKKISASPFAKDKYECILICNIDDQNKKYVFVLKDT